MRWGWQLEPASVIEEQFKGLIVSTLLEETKGSLAQLNIPTVSVSSRNDPWTGSSVTPDNNAIGKLAAEHFQERLFKHFAFVGHNEEPYSFYRYEGFKTKIQPAVCATFWLDDVQPGGSRASNVKLQQFLRSLPTGTGVFTTNDFFGRRVCYNALEVGRKIPEDLAVLGVDADNMISLSSPVNLSSVDPDSAKIGYEAARLLARLMDGGTIHEQICIRPKSVLVAASTDYLVTDVQDIAHALQYIKGQACHGISVEDVAAITGVGRRTLEKRFRAEVGKGIDEVIRDVRLKRAVELMDNSSLTISEISAKAGFSNPFYFSNVFKKHYGVSPKIHRRQL